MPEGQKYVKAFVAVGGLRPGHTGWMKAATADMAIANGYAVSAEKLSDRLTERQKTVLGVAEEVRATSESDEGRVVTPVVGGKAVTANPGADGLTPPEKAKAP